MCWLLLKLLGGVIKHLDDGQWIWSVLAVLGGFHSLNDLPGCSNLWFVFSLIIIRLCCQLLDKKTCVILVVGCLLGAWLYNEVFHVELRWAVAGCMLAFPFYVMGRYLAEIQVEQSLLPKCLTERWRMAIGVVCLFVLVYVVGCYNGQAKMYMNLYGNSLALFVMAAVYGSMALLGLSILLDRYGCKLLRVTSSGTILILVFHRELLHPLLKWINHMDCGVAMGDSLMALASALVVVAFYPIILIVSRFFPIALGRRNIE